MLMPPGNAKVYLCTQVTDMRKSFNGLVAMTSHVIQQDPLSGHLIVFVNRTRDYIKILYYTNGGYCLWCKRLEQGRFSVIPSSGNSVQISHTQLMMWIDGIALEQRHQGRRYSVPQSVDTRV